MILTDHERRVLAYLDQRGNTHRERVVVDLASDDSRIGWRRAHSKSGGYVQGSNGATPMIMANWCRRLTAARLVREVRDGDYHYIGHAITEAGRRLLRGLAAEPAQAQSRTPTTTGDSR